VTYLRVWDLDLTLYGPNSPINAQLVKSALYMRWTRDFLIASNLTVLIGIPDPRRVAELFSEQWRERCDIGVRFNGLVRETSTVAAMSGVNVELIPSDDPALTVTITA
jgi:hypothetical protein